MLRLIGRRLTSAIESCLVLHPIYRHQYTPVSRGQLGELLMAEEAIGLAKSLKWEICPGRTYIPSDSKYEVYKHYDTPPPTSGTFSHTTVDGEQLLDGDAV